MVPANAARIDHTFIISRNRLSQAVSKNSRLRVRVLHCPSTVNQTVENPKMPAQPQRLDHSLLRRTSISACSCAALNILKDGAPNNTNTLARGPQLKTRYR